MNKKLLISTAIALGATSVVASEASTLSVLTKENLTNKNAKADESGVVKVKTSQGKNSSLVVLQSATNSSEQWIETWGDSGDTLNGSSSANSTTKGMLLGREYYLAKDPTPGTDDIKDYYYSPGEVVFKDASDNTLVKGTYTVTDAFLSSFNTGMAVIRYADNGDGNYDPSGKLIDHIFVWGYSTNSYLLGAGNKGNGFQTPHMVHAEDRPSGFEGDNIIELLNSGEYHVEKLYPSRGEGASFISIVDNSGVKRLFGWGYNASYAALVDSTSGTIAFPEECTKLTDESGELLLNNYNIVDFFGGKSGGMIQFTPIDDPTNLKKSRIWVYGSSATFIKGGSGNTQGFLDNEDVPLDESGLIKSGVYINNDVDGNEHDFYDVINNENTYFNSFDIAGDYLVLGLHNGINDKEEIYFTGRQNAGLGFDPISSSARTYWKDISTNFDPLVTNNYLGENKYNIKDLTLSMNHSTAGNATDFTADPTASVVFEDTDGNDTLYMWGSNGKTKSLMGNNGQSDGLVGNDATERAINTTEYFPSYNEGDSFQINETFISSSFVTVFVTEFGENKIYNWGDNSLGQFGLGSPSDTPSSSNVPYLNDRTPTITFQVFNPTKDSIDIKYKVKKFKGINLSDSAGNLGAANSIILTGKGVPGGSMSLLNDDSIDETSGETEWLPVNLSESTLEQGQLFDDWKVEMTYKDAFSQAPDDVVSSQFKVPTFSTTKDLSLTNESIKEVTAESDITDNNPIDETANIVAGERYLDISAMVDNSAFTPITEELINDTKVSADLTSSRYGIESLTNEQLNIVQINATPGSYVSHDYATGINPTDDSVIVSTKDIIKNGTAIDFIIKEPEDMKFNAEFSNFNFSFADGYKGLNDDGTVIDPITDDFYTSYKSTALDVKTATEAARIDSIGDYNETDDTYTFTADKVEDTYFDFKANIYNPDDLGDIKIQLHGKKSDNNNPSAPAEDVDIDTKLITKEFPDGFEHENGITTYEALDLTSNSVYDITSVSITSKDETTSVKTSGSIFTTLPENGAITNPEWTETDPNYQTNADAEFGLSNPVLNFDFENNDKTDIKNIMLTKTVDGEQVNIGLSSFEYELVSFTEEGQEEITSPTHNDITYSDGSYEAKNAYKTGHYSIRIKNLNSAQEIKGIQVIFDSNFKTNAGIDLTNHQTLQSLGDLVIGKTKASSVERTFAWSSSKSNSAQFTFSGYDPDAYDNKTATIVLNDGTKEITKEISNDDITVAPASTRSFGELKTFTFTVDGLSENTTYTVVSFVFDNFDKNEDGTIHQTLPEETITFKTLAPETKPFPWWIIVVVILLIIILLITGLILIYLLVYRKELKDLRTKDNDVKNEKRIEELRIKYPTTKDVKSKDAEGNVQTTTETKPNSNAFDFLIPLWEKIDPLLDKEKEQKEPKEKVQKTEEVSKKETTDDKKEETK